MISLQLESPQLIAPWTTLQGRNMPRQWFCEQCDTQHKNSLNITNTKRAMQYAEIKFNSKLLHTTRKYENQHVYNVCCPPITKTKPKCQVSPAHSPVTCVEHLHCTLRPLKWEHDLVCFQCQCLDAVQSQNQCPGGPVLGMEQEPMADQHLGLSVPMVEHQQWPQWGRSGGPLPVVTMWLRHCETLNHRRPQNRHPSCSEPRH